MSFNFDSVNSITIPTNSGNQQVRWVIDNSTGLLLWGKPIDITSTTDFSITKGIYMIHLIGGGGGGGSGQCVYTDDDDTWNGYGNGGAGGSVLLFTPLNNGTYTFTIGGGGATAGWAGRGNSIGTDGGDSSISYLGSTIIVAGGGKHGSSYYRYGGHSGNAFGGVGGGTSIDYSKFPSVSTFTTINASQNGDNGEAGGYSESGGYSGNMWLRQYYPAGNPLFSQYGTGGGDTQAGICRITYMGGLNSRIWVICDAKTVTLEKGNYSFIAIGGAGQSILGNVGWHKYDGFCATGGGGAMVSGKLTLTTTTNIDITIGGSIGNSDVGKKPNPTYGSSGGDTYISIQGVVKVLAKGGGGGYLSAPNNDSVSGHGGYGGAESESYCTTPFTATSKISGNTGNYSRQEYFWASGSYPISPSFPFGCSRPIYNGNVGGFAKGFVIIYKES